MLIFSFFDFCCLEAKNTIISDLEVMGLEGLRFFLNRKGRKEVTMNARLGVLQQSTIVNPKAAIKIKSYLIMR